MGEYSYKDPVGSTVTVTYSVNQDGTDYEESRKILKAYQTSKSSASKSLFCSSFYPNMQISSYSLIPNDTNTTLRMLRFLSYTKLDLVVFQSISHRHNLNQDLSEVVKIFGTYEASARI